MFIKESCKCLGGKLLEIETSEENEFIKNEVQTLNTGGNFVFLSTSKETYEVYANKTARQHTRIYRIANSLHHKTHVYTAAQTMNRGNNAQFQ